MVAGFHCRRLSLSPVCMFRSGGAGRVDLTVATGAFRVQTAPVAELQPAECTVVEGRADEEKKKAQRV